MRPDFDSGALVRRSKLIGRVLVAMIFAGIALALTQRILQVSEQRNLQATREHLGNSLISLSADYVAQRKALPADWLRRNPFELLRWQQSDYCGELEQGHEPEPGCWYFLPQVAWLLYRSEFSDRTSESGDDLYLFRVQAVPAGAGKDAQWQQGPFALELQPVSAAERHAITLWKD